MAFGSWNDVIAEYNNIYVHTSRFASHAYAMLDLIPRIQFLPEFAQVLPGTSHATFFFEIPKHRTTVDVWYEGDDKYTVYFYDPERGPSQELVVTSEDIVSILQNYAMQLRDME